MILPFGQLRLFKVLKWTPDGNSGRWTKEQEPDPMKNLEETKDLNDADIVASETRSLGRRKGKHLVMFDVDIPMSVVPSTTPGHNHVFFDTYVTRGQLFHLLDVMADCGIVEQGYVSASKARGFTALRLPWIRKTTRSRW